MRAALSDQQYFTAGRSGNDQIFSGKTNFFGLPGFD